MTIRKEFLEIIGNWSNIQDLGDIPRRIKKMDAWMAENVRLGKEEITDEEYKIRLFMQDVQSTREHVRKHYDSH